MRVVAGSAQGIRLDAPGGARVRPTTDRVREAVFAMLGSMGLPAGAEVLDLFAGSGALGIEALSRGAVGVTFVEADRAVLDVLRANLERSGLAEGARVVRGDALRWLADPRRDPDELAPEVALLDPPYEFDRWSEVLDALRARVVVIESDREIALPPHYELHRDRRYASTVVRVATFEELPQ